MRLSTKGRYAVTAMLDLAINQDAGPVTLADISRGQGISLSYLEQLFAKLRRHGLVEGVRGPGGGYRLARPTAQISIADIVVAVDETVDTTLCAGQEDCRDGERGLTHDLWNQLSERIFDYLAGINLGEFLARPAVRDILERQADRQGQGRDGGRDTAAG